MAALSGAVDFDDDDMNFLRMLSSNSTGNTTATTVPAGNTTVAPTTVAPGGNTTVAPAGNTTVAPAGNTTVAPVVTTVASQSNGTEATTVAAGSPPNDGNNDGNQQTEKPSNDKGNDDDGDDDKPKATTLCTATNYEHSSLKPPADKTITDNEKANKDKFLFSTCIGPKEPAKDSAASSHFAQYGSNAKTAANKAKCTGNGGTVEELTCGSKNLTDWYNGRAHMYSVGVLQECCGASKSNQDITVPGIKTSGTVSTNLYSDAKCTTPLKESDVSKNQWYTLGLTQGSWTMGGCEGGMRYGGAGWSLAGCNANGTVLNFYFDSSCNTRMFTAELPLHAQCTEREDTEGNTTVTYYQKDTCEGTEPTQKKVVTTVTSKFDETQLTAKLQTTADKDAFRAAYQEATVAEYRAALPAASSTATVEDEHIYTGLLAKSSRRLAGKRQLAAGDTTATSILTVSLPAAAADQAKSDLATNFDKDKLATAIQSKVATTMNFNLTVTVQQIGHVDVPDYVSPATGGGGGGSTSAASGSAAVFGFASAIAVAAALFF